ncbi:uncharacterized protein LOC144713646 isoform X3 [Wolffia australiana]
MAGIFGKLRSLDAYPKINEDFYSRTLSGGIITIVSSVFMFLLFLSELGSYIYPTTETILVVDTTRGETLRINIEKPLQRHGGRLEHNETYCGSCYGAETSDEDCCNSCEEVREAYKKKGWGIANPDLIDQCKREGFLQRIKDEVGEGCNVYGFLEVKKVAGNFHFSPGKSFQQADVHVHDLLGFQKDSFNISHKINKLTFGDHFPGIINPLDSTQWIQLSQNGIYQYFIKVVPTVYTNINGHVIKSNQFSVTEHFRSEFPVHRYLPGVYFYYDLSPIKVTFKEAHIPFLHFLTTVCAIVGGVFTVSGILDSVVYQSQRAIKKKMEIGKLT